MRNSSWYHDKICFFMILWGFYHNMITKPSKTIIENNLRYYSHLFSQHCFNNKKQCTLVIKKRNSTEKFKLLASAVQS